MKEIGIFEFFLSNNFILKINYENNTFEIFSLAIG